VSRLSFGLLPRVVLGLGVTQIVGWGTTFLMPAVLGRHMQAALDLPSEVIFGGITVMFATGALFSPRIGRLVDRTGPRLLMASGSVMFAASMTALAYSSGVVSYLLSWAGLGIASTLALGTPSSVAIVQAAGPRARQAIAVFTIIAGFASTVFWPTTGALDAALGWRGALLVYAGVHLLICGPIHFLMLPRAAPQHPSGASGPAGGGGVPSEHRSRAFVLLSISLCFGAFVFTGAMVQMIDILRGTGQSPANALLLASLIGPSQVCIRMFELLFGHRYSIMNAAILGSVMLPIGLALALVSGGSFTLALLFILAYGTSNGMKAVQRATLPLALFGRAQYGAYLGRLALPQGIVAAVAPPMLAAVMSRFGASGALTIALASATVSLIAMVMLARLGRGVR
jgi:hypothetical protein